MSSCNFMALNTIALLTTPKFMSSSQTSALNSRLMHHCLLTSPCTCWINISDLTCPKLLTTPHASCKCSLFSWLVLPFLSLLFLSHLTSLTLSFMQFGCLSFQNTSRFWSLPPFWSKASLIIWSGSCNNTSSFSTDNFTLTFGPSNLILK